MRTKKLKKFWVTKTKFLKTILVLLFISIIYMWYVGINVDIPKEELSHFLLDDMGSYVAFFDYSSGKCYFQSINKYGIQKTVCSISGYDLIPGKEADFINTFSDKYYCTINFVKPWYYIKMRFFFRHYNNSLEHEFYNGFSLDSPKYAGHIVFGEFTSEKHLFKPMSDYRSATLWKLISTESGVDKYIKRDVLIPSIYNKSISSYEDIHSRNNIKWIRSD